MIKIRKTSIENADKQYLLHKQWGYESYSNEVYAQLAYDDTGFLVQFTVNESNPLRTKQNHFESVCQDSCVEFFVNFTPTASDRYFNIEINANGIADMSFRRDRYEFENVTLEEVTSLKIKPCIRDTYWTVTYHIGFDLIKKYFPKFDINDCEYIIGNLYKCGDCTDTMHYLSYFEVKTPTPDYHRPEYFGKMFIDSQPKQ